MTLKQETWHQDPADHDLWMGGNGLIVNTAALDERADYFEIVRAAVLPQPTETLSTVPQALF